MQLAPNADCHKHLIKREDLVANLAAVTGCLEVSLTELLLHIKQSLFYSQNNSSVMLTTCLVVQQQAIVLYWYCE